MSDIYGPQFSATSSYFELTGGNNNGDDKGDGNELLYFIAFLVILCFGSSCVSSILSSLGALINEMQKKDDKKS